MITYNAHAPYSTNIGLSDLPSDTDALGIEKHCNGLTDFLRQCSSPMTIAIQGDWGTGKTSLMKQLEKNLKNNNGRTIWFNTWQFAVLGEQDRLLIDLLEVLCFTIKDICSESQETNPKLRKILKFLKRVGRGATVGSISAIAETIKALSAIDAPKVIDDIKAELKEQDEAEKEIDNYNYESYAMMVSELRTDLEELIRMYLGENPRLYIFIDDLDRLEPIRAVELMEGLKNFLDIPQCVFVLAIDPEVVETGLIQKYGKDVDNKKIFRFFDKIIQVPYKLPTHNYKLEKYMKEILKGYDENNIEMYVKFLTEANIHNPRTIKRCVNLCLLQKCMDRFEKGISNTDNYMFFHRYIVKMIELEDFENYRSLYNTILALNDDYDTIEKTLNKICTENHLLSIVLSHFIYNTEKSEYIMLFADYIKYSSISDSIEITSLTNIGKFTDIVQFINDNAINNLSCAYTDEVKKVCTNTNNKTPKVSTHELIKYIIDKNDFELLYEYPNGTLQLSIKRELYKITVSMNISTNLNEFELFNGTRYYMDSALLPFAYDDDTFENMYSIPIIENTSSPNNPIYKVLRNAGFIE